MKIIAKLFLIVLALIGLGLGTARHVSADEPTTTHATAPNEFVEVGGSRFAYRWLGPASGTPLLFLQHFTGTMDGWDPLVTDGLAQNRPVILFNNRGVGLSDGATPDTVEAMARDTIAFLDALGIAQVDLLGFSLGGFVAQELGLRHPERVRRVILAGTGPRGGQGMQESRPDVVAALQSGNLDQARAYLFFSQSQPSQAAARRFLDRTKQRSADHDTQTSAEATQSQGKAIHAWGQIASNADWIARLRDFRPATLVVNGNDDIMIPTINTYALSQAIPKAQLIVYPDAGHGALFQYAELFVQHARLFLDRDDEGSTAWWRSSSRAAESSGTSFRISSQAWSSNSRPIPGTRPSKSRRAPVLCSTDLHFNQEDTSMIKSSNLSAAVTTVSAVILAGAANAQPAHNTSDGKPVKNVVLVHGAFADGSGWRGVYDELTQRGYRVTVVQNPLTSLADDVAATQRALDRQNGPTILVGHSWGGTVITEAGTHSNVAGLVYVSALAPDAGETTAQQYEGFAPTPEFVIETHEQGFGFLSPEKFKAGFAHDVSDADAAFMRDSQVPINMSVFGTKLNNAAWRTKPSWAVIATEDKAFDQAMLLHMAKRIGAKITKVSASHAVFMTQPKVVADTIDRAARSVSQGANAAHP